MEQGTLESLRDGKISGLSEMVSGPEENQNRLSSGNAGRGGERRRTPIPKAPVQNLKNGEGLIARDEESDGGFFEE